MLLFGRQINVVTDSIWAAGMVSGGKAIRIFRREGVFANTPKLLLLSRRAESTLSLATYESRIELMIDRA